MTDAPALATVRLAIDACPQLWRGMGALLAEEDGVSGASASSEAMDALGLEIGRVLQRCSRPAASISSQERDIDLCLFRAVVSLDDKFREGHDDPRSGALLVLFRRMVITPSNLEALCRIVCDRTIRVGEVRCTAVALLYTLCSVKSIWRVEIREQSSQACSFALRLLQVMASLLDPSDVADPSNHEEGCVCDRLGWFLLASSLIACDEEPPDRVIRVLLQHNWKSIFDQPPGRGSGGEDDEMGKASCFVKIHEWARRGMFREGQMNNVQARHLLRDLGSCGSLFRRVLRRSDSLLALPISVHSDERCVWIGFLYFFLHCLLPLPDNDRELDQFVDRTRRVLSEACSRLVRAGVEVIPNDEVSSEHLLACLGQWETLKHESQTSRELRFASLFLQRDTRRVTSAAFKDMKKMSKEELCTNVAHLSRGEMCANCHLLESDLGRRLERCARCQQIKYCSRKCQVEHWKKVHKKQCKASS